MSSARLDRFADRRDAGRRLAQHLVDLRPADPVVVALPRGGVPVAAEIATTLGAPLEILAVRKLGAPGNPEYGIGAIAEDGTRVIDPEATATVVGRECRPKPRYCAGCSTKRSRTSRPRPERCRCSCVASPPRSWLRLRMRVWTSWSSAPVSGGPLRRRLHRSVTSTVMQDAKCPVLISPTGVKAPVPALA